MSLAIMLIPTETKVGLTSISLGITRAMKHKGIHPNLFKPIEQPYDSNSLSDQTIAVFRKYSKFFLPIEPLKISYVESMISCNQKDLLMEEIIANYYANKTQDTEVVLIEGLAPTYKHQFTYSLNYEIAKTLNAKIIFVMSQNSDTPEQIKKRIYLICNNFGSVNNSNISGIIFDELYSTIKKTNHIHLNVPDVFNDRFKKQITNTDLINIKKNIPFPILGVIPYSLDLIATRAIDIARYLNATVINKGKINTCRINSVIFCLQNISYMKENFHAGSLLVISSDYPDMLVSACLIAMRNTKISAILLTDGHEIDVRVRNLCNCAFESGLPVFMVDINIWQTALYLKNFNLDIPTDDHEQFEKIIEYISNHINVDYIKSLDLISDRRCWYLSPPDFRYRLTELARKAGKRVVLPEGNEPRIIKAASICANRRIATCVLLGDSDDINHVATSQGIKLKDGIEIINPKVIREEYTDRLVELRKNKGMTEASARDLLKDNIVLGTLMLEKGEVDGLISGAIHTTAHTIRPSLQLIKTMPGRSLVSSIFFMLFPEQVHIYGDCAINLDPTAEQLSEIAIQSADSALTFGIEPRVAMLSYSTGTSGSGVSVEKVLTATCLARERRPDLTIDGPLQYDAAVIPDVAKLKAPYSSVAGHANVFIFPDLNSGNITYKAVQRSSNLVSIGPMLQGMRKPVNDLSRGALVEDIVYTIALTVIQATQQKSPK